MSRISRSSGVLGQWTISTLTIASPTILSATKIFTSFWPSGSTFGTPNFVWSGQDEDPPHWEIGSVVSAGNTPSSAAEGPAFSLEDDDETAAAAAAAPAAAQRRRRRRRACAPPPPPRWRLSDYNVQHVVHGIYKHCSLFETVSPAELLPAGAPANPVQPREHKHRVRCRSSDIGKTPTS